MNRRRKRKKILPGQVGFGRELAAASATTPRKPSRPEGGLGRDIHFAGFFIFSAPKKKKGPVLKHEPFRVKPFESGD